MSAVFSAQVTSKAAYSFQSRVSLCHRHGPTSPIDCCCCANMCLTSRGSKAREAVQQIVRTVVQCLALRSTSFDMTSQQSRQCLADFGCFMRVAHRNAPDYGIYGLLDFWQIFGKTVF
jgi:hypothetical protein